MEISCDGKTVTFKQGAFEKSFDKNAIDSTNPAIVLYEVFSYIDSLETVNSYAKDGEYIVKGKTSIGTFTLVQNKDGKIKSVSLPSVRIEIEFSG